MAKTSYLNMVNRILIRINQNPITDVTSAVGHSLMIGDFINEGQNAIYAEPVNWYSLYATSTITTVASTGDYNVPSDHGRTLSMMNVTSNWLMVEDFTKNFDLVDADGNLTGQPTHFTIQGNKYRLFPIPSGAETLRIRYYKVPAPLASNNDVTNLPIECDNLLILYGWFSILNYLHKYDQADRITLNYTSLLKKAKVANGKILDRMLRFQEGSYYGRIIPPRLPSHYGYRIK